VFDEPFSATKMVAFVLIWIAMSIFAYTLVKKSPS
jgi:EamA domain-containing membrane protein RarD